MRDDFKTVNLPVRRSGSWLYMIAKEYPTLAELRDVPDRVLLRMPLVGTRSVRMLREAISEIEPK
jgi:hypothetical protein